MLTGQKLVGGVARPARRWRRRVIGIRAAVAEMAVAAVYRSAFHSGCLCQPGWPEHAEAGGIVAKTEAAGMKRLSRVLVIALVVVVALVSYDITFPAGKSASSNWTFALTHPTLLLHIVVATGILLMAVIALIISIRARDRPWVALSVAGWLSSWRRSSPAKTMSRHCTRARSTA
jgi:hypothetical protein